MAIIAIMPIAKTKGPLVTATEAKNAFGQLLEKALQGEVVVITKHDSPKAVLISVDQYAALANAPEIHLNHLSVEFDALLLRMQRSGARKAIQAAFHASAAELGKVAVAAKRKRG